MPKKMNTRRADGRYCISVYIGLVDGKRKYKCVYGHTQKEAQLKADELKSSLRKGVDISRDTDTFESWKNFWLSAKKAETSGTQYKMLKSRANLLSERVGDTKLVKIVPMELQSIINDLAEENPHTRKPTAKKTLKEYKNVLINIFEYAIDNRACVYNPAAKLKIPTNAPQKQRRALTPEERQMVIEFRHRAQPSAMLMMFSGLRRGEATALTWNDVNLDAGTISVTRSYDFKNGEFKCTKNGKSRIVSIPDILIDYLKSLPRSGIYVLTTANGKMMTDTAWKRMYNSYMYDLNLKYGTFLNTKKKYSPEKIPMKINPFTPHELRHTFCTIMYEAGVDVLVAKEQMGHSDVKTTLSIYTHLSEQHKSRDISKLNQYIPSASNTVSESC